MVFWECLAGEIVITTEFPSSTAHIYMQEEAAKAEKKSPVSVSRARTAYATEFPPGAARLRSREEWISPRNMCLGIPPAKIEDRRFLILLQGKERRSSMNIDGASVPNLHSVVPFRAKPHVKW